MRISLVSLVLISAIAISYGCESTSTPQQRKPGEGPGSTSFRWQQFHNLPSTHNLSAGHMVGPDEVYAVGPTGQVIAWNGQAWAEEELSIISSLYGVWGVEGTVFAVGNEGRVFKRDQLGWYLGESNTDFDLRAIHGYSADHIFAVGDGGCIIHYDGATWMPTPSSVTTPLFGVWVSSEFEAFAVGLDGVILRWSLTGWTQMDTPTRDALTAIHGTATNNLFAVGNHGTIIRYIGDEWRSMENDHPDVLQAVLAFSPNHVLAAGANGTLLRFDGTKWDQMPTTLSGWIYGLTGFDGLAYGLGSGVLIKYDDREWRPDPDIGVENINGVWGTSMSDVTAVGDEGSILKLRDGRWTEQDSGTRRALKDVWASSPTDIYAVGDNRILHYEGQTWTREVLGGGAFTAVFGTAADNVLAMNEAGQIYKSNGDGQWRIEYDAATGLGLHGAWGPGENAFYESADIHAVGDRTLVLFDGEDWSATFPNERFNDVTGHVVDDDTLTYVVYAVGDNGVVIQQNTRLGIWEPIPTETQVSLHAVVIGRYDHVYVAGDDGIVQSYDGDKWTNTSPEENGRFNSIWASPDGEMFLGGGGAPRSGVIFFYGRE